MRSNINNLAFDKTLDRKVALSNAEFNKPNPIIYQTRLFSDLDELFDAIFPWRLTGHGKKK